VAAPLIHLICGSTGAGKSTDARRLPAEIGAVHFSLDQWTAAPYWTGNPLPFAITRATFDYVEATWEPPGGAEMAMRDGLCLRA
jgi:hypothetical protein